MARAVGEARASETQDGGGAVLVHVADPVDPLRVLEKVGGRAAQG